MGRDVFMNCENLTSVHISSSLTNIGPYAFEDCTSLTSVTIPSSVTSIGIVAFYGCSNLTTLNIPASVTSVGGAAFGNCVKLKSVDIRSPLTSIGKQAFLSCNALLTINVYSATPPVVSTQAFDGVNKTTCILNVPTGSKAAYQAADEWKNFSIISETDMKLSLKELWQQGINLSSGIGFIAIKLNQSANISIYSITGKEIYKSKLFEGDNHINLSRGIYHVKINDISTKVLIR